MDEDAGVAAEQGSARSAGPGVDSVSAEWSLDRPGPASWAIAVAASIQLHLNSAMARQLAAIDDALDRARSHPSLFVGYGCGSGAEAVELAVTAVVAELATAMHVSEGTIRVQATHAATLLGRMPRLWQRFFCGETSYQHVRVVLELAVGLPDAPAVWSEYDEALADVATSVTPGVLRVKARRLRERLDAEPLRVRHERSRAERRTWVEAGVDGMAWLGAYLPADAAFRAEARITGTARSLSVMSGETRTLAQLKADVLADLLTGDGTPYAVKTTVGLTLPMLSLLGHDRDRDRDHPATLNGMIPVDPETARRLAVHAPSFHRILTDPVSSTVLDVDRRSYRIPTDLRRWLELTRPVCAFPGCLRNAAEADADHIRDWALDGATSDDNLQPLCKKHHRMKHRTGWSVRNPDHERAPTVHDRSRTPDRAAGSTSGRSTASTSGSPAGSPADRTSGRTSASTADRTARSPVRSRWTSPTGRIHDSDPPF